MAKRRRTPVEAPPPAARDQPIAIGICLVLLTAFVYWGVQRFDFVNWDDPTYLTENSNVQQGLTASNVFWALTTSHSPYWHPLTWLSHMTDVSLYGMDPGPHHVTSVLIHAASTVLLFLLLRRMTGDTGPSAFVAAMFAVHPLHVESVAWLAERKDVLSSFLLLVTLWMYVRYVERPSRGRYAGIVAAYALALMSKPMVVTLPFALLLLDVWPLRRFSRRAVGEKAPLVALAAATSIATFVVQKQVGAVAGLSALPLGLRIQNALIGYVAYLWSAIWPFRLAAFYPLRDIAPWEAVSAAVLLCLLTLGAVLIRRRHPYVFVGWFWYLVTVAPVIGLMQAGEQARADRFMYVPIVGLLIAASWTARAAWREAARRRATLGRTSSAVGVSIAAAIVLAFAIVSRAQAATWSDSITLWQHAARVTAGNYIAYENMGQALREKGRLMEAQANYRRALELAPRQSPGYEAVIHNSLGMVLERDGRAREARDHFALAVQLSPRFAEARTNLGNALAGDSEFEQAVAQYRVAIDLKPDYIEPRVGLGATLLRLRRPAEAMPQYAAALRIDPGSAQAHNGLGGALAMEGKDEDAMAEYREALRLKPDLPSAHLNVALLLMKKGDVAEARRHLETALSIDPGYEPARQALRAIDPGA